MAVCRTILILCVASLSAMGQTDRYMVFFKDKNGSPHSIDQPSTFLSARSLDRREKQGVAVTEEDLPVTPSYVAQVRGAGTKVFFSSRWMNALLIESTPAIASIIAGLPFVSAIEKVAPNHKLIGGRGGKAVREFNAGISSSTDSQLAMLGIDKMHEDGFYGEGVMIAILDSGFPGVSTIPPFQPVVLNSQVKMTVDFVTNSGNVYQFYNHGTLVFSTIAAESTDFDGGAPQASYLLFATEDAFSEYRVEEYNWLFAAEKADSAGADIIQSSLGYSTFDDPQMDYKITELNGNTAVVSKAAAHARDRGIIVVTSAGNEGNGAWRYITPPADVDGILSVGAVNLTGSKVVFSSVGPTADGRVKPDVVALGIGVAVVEDSGQLGTADGTSLSAPLVTSLVAGLMQACPEVKPTELIQAIKASASQAAKPDNELGFGIPKYLAVKNYLEASMVGADVYAYPNPVSSTLWVTLKDLPVGQVDIVIYDQQGKILSSANLSITWTNNPIAVAVSELAAGLYLLRVRTSAMVKTIRFLKY